LAINKIGMFSDDGQVTHDEENDDSRVGDENSAPKGASSEAADDILKQVEALKAKEEDQGEGKGEGDEEMDLYGQLEEEKNKALRAVAELQNAKRRMEEDKRNFAAFATQGLVVDLLSIVESFNKMVVHMPEELVENEWAKGVVLIDGQLNKFLEKQGVKKIEAVVGGDIDVAKHEVVLQGEGESGKIIEVMSDGYEMNGRTILTAKVKVGA
jgi:molecular chaperone GrpE